MNSKKKNITIGILLVVATLVLSSVSAAISAILMNKFLVNGDVTSFAGVEITRENFGDNYIWINTWKLVTSAITFMLFVLAEYRFKKADILAKLFKYLIPFQLVFFAIALIGSFIQLLK